MNKSITGHDMSDEGDTVKALDAIDTADPERAHVFADQYLLDYLRHLEDEDITYGRDTYHTGAGEVADAYQRVIERTRWWACG